MLGLSRHPFSDLYHRALVSRWRSLFVVLFAIYLGTNVFFALLYNLGGDTVESGQPGSFTDALFLSTQTLSTVGYGHLAPKGLYGNALAAFESLLGMLGFAVLAGFMFAKLSRPTAKVIFSKVAIVGKRDGRPALMFRMANGRESQIYEARLSVVMVKSVMTPEGEPFRMLFDMPLVRRESPLFASTWTAVHPIDEKSPFWGETAETLAVKSAEIYLTFVGIEAILSQTVHSRHTYRLNQLRWSHRFVDVLKVDADGRAHIDYEHFHDSVPMEKELGSRA